MKDINDSLIAKEKLYSVVKARKVRLNAKEVDTAELITYLIAKQAELEHQKTVNSEMKLRMDSLAGVEENQEDLDHQLLHNADQLLLQQNNIHRMNLMDKGISRQRDIIAQLEKVFEQGEVAHRVNEALRQQSDRLAKLQAKKQEGLNHVYDMIRQHGKQGGSVSARYPSHYSALNRLSNSLSASTPSTLV